MGIPRQMARLSGLVDQCGAGGASGRLSERQGGGESIEECFMAAGPAP